MVVLALRSRGTRVETTIFTEPNRNQTIRVEPLSFVLNNQEHAIHFMFIIQGDLSRVIFSICSCFHVYKTFFFCDCDADFFFLFLFHFRYINRRVCILNQYVIKLPKQFNQILSEKSLHSSVSHTLYETPIPYNVLKLDTYLHCCALTRSGTVYRDWFSLSGLVKVSDNSGPKRHSGCRQIDRYTVLRQGFSVLACGKGVDYCVVTATEIIIYMFELYNHK